MERGIDKSRYGYHFDSNTDDCTLVFWRCANTMKLRAKSEDIGGKVQDLKLSIWLNVLCYLNS